MYRKQGVSPRLKDVLDKLHNKEKRKKTVVYSSADILAAKTVLDRLLAAADRNEVSSITPVPRECDEI